MMKKYCLYSLFFAVLLGTSCNKEFLNKKPSTNIVQPTTLDDLQSLLENGEAVNHSSALAVISSDEFEYPSYEIWQSLRTATERNSYIWAADLFGGEVDGGDWNQPYEMVFYANNVLERLSKIHVNSMNLSQWSNIKGWALFVRAFAYFDLVKNFSPAYDQNTSEKDLGVPLKLNPSIDEILPRATVKQTYEKILSDLEEAISLLRTELSFEKRNRPSKASAYALGARIYLSMRNYQEAEKYSDSCLALYDRLIDYNTINLNSATPFSKTNEETLFPASVIINYPASTVASNRYINISAELLSLYDENDLRRSIYFTQSSGRVIVKRNYYGGGLYPFTGLATDEIYLIKAECLARRGEFQKSMDILNRLLINRYDNKRAYVPLIAESATDALEKVLVERRKELVWRGLRWDDLKRLNKEGANIVLKRKLNNIEYLLPPNDPRYVFPIPDNEITLSGIEQNNR